MQRSGDTPQQVADAQKGNWVDSFAPLWFRPYARLARWDRPVPPLLLLFWPCAMGWGWLPSGARTWLRFCRGAAVSRRLGSHARRRLHSQRHCRCRYRCEGCAHRSRPLPSGQVTERGAFISSGLQCLAGLAVLTYFNAFTIWLAIASLVLVVIYPFMKRVTWWPQFFLGLAFNWGALIGWSSATGDIGAPALTLYLAGILWTIGYDTIYALQDVEDDALIGVKSTARLFGRRTRVIVAGISYGDASALGRGRLGSRRWPLISTSDSSPSGCCWPWQVWTLHPKEPQSALVRFRSNHWVGLLLSLALLVDHWL